MYMLESPNFSILKLVQLCLLLFGFKMYWVDDPFYLQLIPQKY